MKSIELAEEHKVKLLEMCKVLFPESPWDFGIFYTSEVGAEYIGLDYLDVTHLNHKIPCILSRFELEHNNIDTTNLKIVKKDNNYSNYDKLQYDFVNNIEPLKKGFMLDDEGNVTQHSGNYDETYVETIHWFEFCCNILVNKLFDNSFDFGKIYYDLLSSNHPVDYLYEEFKKLK